MFNNLSKEEKQIKRYLKSTMSINTENVVKFLITGSVALTLTACGGGGGGSSTPTPPSAVIKNENVLLNGKEVAITYTQNADGTIDKNIVIGGVSAQINGDNSLTILDKNITHNGYKLEGVTITNKDGVYTFEKDGTSNLILSKNQEGHYQILHNNFTYLVDKNGSLIYSDTVVTPPVVGEGFLPEMGVEHGWDLADVVLEKEFNEFNEMLANGLLHEVEGKYYLVTDLENKVAHQVIVNSKVDLETPSEGIPELGIEKNWDLADVVLEKEFNEFNEMLANGLLHEMEGKYYLVTDVENKVAQEVIARIESNTVTERIEILGKEYEIVYIKDSTGAVFNEITIDGIKVTFEKDNSITVKEEGHDLEGIKIAKNENGLSFEKNGVLESLLINTGNKINFTGSINSSTNSLNGLVASNGSVVENSGNISTSGDNSHGMYATGEGSQAINKGNITVSGEGSYGMYADKGGYVENALGATITVGSGAEYGIYAENNNFKNYGNIVVEDDTIGVFVKGSDVSNLAVMPNDVVLNDGNIIVKGRNAIGLYGGEKAHISNSALIEANGQGSVGIYVEKGSTVKNDGKININSNESYGIYSKQSVISSLGEIFIGDSAENSIGIYAEDSKISNLEFLNIKGNKNIGVYLINSELTNNLKFQEVAWESSKNTALRMENSLMNNAEVGIYFSERSKEGVGFKLDNSIIKNSSVSMLIYGENARGIIAENGSVINFNSLNDNNLRLKTDGIGAKAIELYSSTIKLDKGNYYWQTSKIETKKANSTGIFGVDSFIDSGADVETSEYKSHGIHGINSNIINRGNITTLGFKSHGIYIEGKEGLAKNYGIITTSGENAHGMYATHGATIKNEGIINVNGKNSYGMVADENSFIENNGQININISGGALGETYKGIVAVKSLIENKGLADVGNYSEGFGLLESEFENYGLLRVSGESSVGALGSKSELINIGGVSVYGNDSIGLKGIDSSNIVNISEVNIYGNGIGIFSENSNVYNSGDINAQSGIGILGEKSYIKNSGMIDIDGVLTYGIYANNSEIISPGRINTNYWSRGVTGIYAENSHVSNINYLYLIGKWNTGLELKNSELSGFVRVDIGWESQGSTGINLNSSQIKYGDILMFSYATSVGETGIRMSNSLIADSYLQMKIDGDNSVGIIAENDSLINFDLSKNTNNQLNLTIYGNGTKGIELYGSTLKLTKNEETGINNKIETKKANSTAVYGINSFIDSEANIETSEYKSYGIHGINSKVINRGNIVTSGFKAHGIYVEGMEGLAENFGSLTTNGESSHGMYATHGATIKNYGTINVNGKNSYGMVADENSYLQNNGQINVSGIAEGETFRGVIAVKSLVENNNSVEVEKNNEGFTLLESEFENYGLLNTKGESSIGVLGIESELINLGTVLIEGKNSIGMKGIENSNIVNVSDIILCEEGIGIFSENSNVYNSGNIELKSGIGILGKESYIGNSNKINIEGDSIFGIYATNSEITSPGTIKIKENSSDSIGIYAKNSKVLNISDISISGNKNIGLYLKESELIGHLNISIKEEAKESIGLKISNSTLDETEISVTINGQNSIGILAENESFINSNENGRLTIISDGIGSIGVELNNSKLKLGKNNKIETKKANSTGIYTVESIVNSGANITTESFRSDGIQGYYSIITNSGSITTNDYTSNGISAIESDVTNSGTITINSKTSYGIYGNKSNVLNTGLISTHDYRSHGVFLEDSVFKNSGIIETTGEEAHGVYAVGAGTYAVNEKDGVILTSGTKSHGMYAMDGASIINEGTISVTGAGSYGMYGLGYNVLVENNGIINVGESSAGEIYIGTDTSGSTVINNSIVNVEAGSKGYDLKDEAWLINLGTINANGNNSIGVFANNSTVETIDYININGERATGVYGTNNSAIANSGWIKANADESVAIRLENSHFKNNGRVLAEGDRAIAVLGEQNSTVENRLIIEANGEESIGIKVDSGSRIINFASGKIYAKGTGAVGVMLGDSDFINGGEIHAIGDNSFGIKGSGLHITNGDMGPLGIAGYIETEGDNSTGIYADNNSIVVNNSEVYVYGKDSVGIDVTDSTVINNEEVFVYGDGSTGIRGDNSTIANHGIVGVRGGNATGVEIRDSSLVINTGTIEITGGERDSEKSYAIHVTGKETTVNNSGNILAKNPNSLAVKFEGAGELNNSGNIVAYSEKDKAVVMSNGADFVNLYAGSHITGWIDGKMDRDILTITGVANEEIGVQNFESLIVRDSHGIVIKGASMIHSTDSKDMVSLTNSSLTNKGVLSMAGGNIILKDGSTLTNEGIAISSNEFTTNHIGLNNKGIEVTARQAILDENQGISINVRNGKIIVGEGENVTNIISTDSSIISNVEEQNILNVLDNTGVIASEESIENEGIINVYAYEKEALGMLGEKGNTVINSGTINAAASLNNTVIAMKATGEFSLAQNQGTIVSTDIGMRAENGGTAENRDYIYAKGDAISVSEGFGENHGFIMAGTAGISATDNSLVYNNGTIESDIHGIVANNSTVILGNFSKIDAEKYDVMAENSSKVVDMKVENHEKIVVGNKNLSGDIYVDSTSKYSFAGAVNDAGRTLLKFQDVVNADNSGMILSVNVTNKENREAIKLENSNFTNSGIFSAEARIRKDENSTAINNGIVLVRDRYDFDSSTGIIIDEITGEVIVGEGAEGVINVALEGTGISGEGKNIEVINVYDATAMEGSYGEKLQNSGTVNIYMGEGLVTENGIAVNNRYGIINSQGGIAMRGKSGVLVNDGILNLNNSIGMLVKNGEAVNNGEIYVGDLSAGIYGEGQAIVENVGLIYVAGEESTAMGSSAQIDYYNWSNSTFTNTGDIVLAGNFTSGMFVTDGDKGINEGLISILGKNSTGMEAIIGSTVENNGTIIVDGQNSIGMSAIGLINPDYGYIERYSNATNNGEIFVVGTGSYGMVALQGGIVTNSETGTIHVGDTASGAMLASGYGAQAINNGTIIISNKNDVTSDKNWDGIIDTALRAENGGWVVNNGKIETADKITISTSNGGKYVIGTSEDGTYGTIKAGAVSIQGDVEVKTRIAQGSYRDHYTLNNVIEADEIEGAGEFNITSDSLLYDAESNLDRWGNIDVDLIKNGTTVADHASENWKAIASIVGEGINDKEYFDSLSSDAKYVTNKVFGTTSSTASIDNTMEQISGKAYANMSTQILGTADAFLNQNRALLTSDDDSDVRIGIMSGYEDVSGTDSSLGYSGERGGIVLAKKLLNTDFGKTYASVGYAVGELKYDGGGKNKIETWDLAIYNMYAKDEVELKTNLSLDMNTHNVERRVKFDTINRTAKADFDSYSITFGNEFSYGFNFGNYKLKPLALFDLTYINQDAISENRADALNLSLPSESYLSAIGGLGIRGEAKLGRNSMVFAEAKYLHQFGNLNKEQEATIEGWNKSFKIAGSEDKKDAVEFKVGGKLSYRNIDFTGDVSKKFNSFDNQFKANAGIAVKF